MSLFSNKRYGDNFELVPNESYDFSSGLGRIMYDSEINEMAIYEALFLEEIDHIHSVNEGVILESELEAIQEASVGGFFKKIADFFRKLGEKIVAIINSFIKKLQAIMTTNNKELITKFRKEINSKTFTKFKYKTQKVKGGKAISEIVKPEEALNSLEIIELNKSKNAETELGKTSRSSSEKFQKDLDDSFDEEEIKVRLLNVGVTGMKISEVSDFEKEAMETIFEDEEEYDDFSSYKSYVENILTNSKDEISALNKKKTKIEKQTKNLVSHFEKLEKSKTFDDREKIKASYSSKATDVDGYTGSSNTAGGGFAAKSGDVGKIAKIMALYQYKVALAGQAAINKLLTFNMQAVKKNIANCRAVYVKAVGFNPKLVKEDAILQEFAYQAELDYDDMM